MLTLKPANLLFAEFQWVSDGEGEDESTDQQLSQGPVPPNEDEEEGTG